MTQAKPTGPLTGVRILDLTSVVNGAYATQILGDQGADIIKLEDPGGDIMRRPGVPPDRNAENLGPLFLTLNRNKRSIVLDLKKDRARAAMTRLIASCDVFVASVRYEALTRLGLSYEDVSAIRPDVVYAHAAGFGSEGPYAGLPAYDDLIQSASGMADLYPRTFGGPPAFLPTQAADKISGLFMAQAISAALFHRERTGEGQFVEVPMLECVTSFVLVENLYGHVYQPPADQYGYPRTLNPFRKPFPTKDGYIGMLPYNDRHWELFFQVAGFDEDFAARPEFATMAGRNNNIRDLYSLVEKAAATRTTQEWIDLLRPLSIPVIALNRLDDLESDPHLRTVGFFEQHEHPQAGAYQVPHPPVRFAATPSSIRSHAPLLGEHTSEILAEVGLSEDEIAQAIGS
ncbi:MAG: CoA transferase [Novosphingobium sp.]|nr:CoA transferase [Novosphingobium sp.]